MRLKHGARTLSALCTLALAGCYSGLSETAASGGTAGEAGESADAGEGGPGGGPGGEGGPGGTGGESGEGGTGGEASCDEVGAGVSPLRRLTRREFNNTIADLLGDKSDPASILPLDDASAGFNNNAETLSTPSILVEGYEAAADQVIGNVLGDVDAFLSCTPGQDRTECVQNFISTFGRRAFRRTLSAEDSGELLAFYQDASSEFDEPTAVRLLVKAILMSPDFLYRVEIGSADTTLPANTVRLTHWEVASRLSYMLWNSMPDDELLDAAEAGLLETPEQLEAQARRMLESPRALDALQDFHGQWLGYDKVDKIAKEETIYPDFTPEARALLKRESETFIERELWENDASVLDLFTANHSYMNADLARFYNIPNVPSTGEFVRVELDPSRYAGLLTQAGVIASHSSAAQTSPILRGEWVLKNLACTPPPPPPDDVPPPPDPSPDATTRERFAQHTAEPACAGCHKLLDPLGFAFEGFGADGRWRATENGFPVDTSGVVAGLGPDLNGPVSGLNELAERLGRSEKVRDCVVTQWFRYGHGRSEKPEDACSLASMRDALDRSDGSVKELLVALVQTDAFVLRTRQ